MARHILLADDSTTIHRVVKELLVRENFTVTCVETGEEALRALLDKRPALVLADLTMPRLGGIELCGMMKREAEYRDIPVVFLVSPFDDYNEDMAARAGGAGHLVKPFDSYKLMNLIRELLPEEKAEGVDAEEPVKAWRTTSDDDASDLPEPMRLDSDVDNSSDALIEITDLGALDAETAEVTIPEGEGVVEPLLNPEPLGRVDEEALARFDAMGGSAEVSRVLRDVIREEVRRLLPEVIERVVRERVAELEAEADAISARNG